MLYHARYAQNERTGSKVGIDNALDRRIKTYINDKFFHAQGLVLLRHCDTYPVRLSTQHARSVTGSCV